MTENLTSYGGNVQVVASMHEIDRVAKQLAAVEHLLMHLPPTGIGADINPSQLLLSLEIPTWLVRLRYLQFCLWVSRQSYLTAEARVRGVMHALMPGVTQSLATGLAGKSLSTKEFSVRQVGQVRQTSSATSLHTLLNRLEKTALLADGTMRIESWVTDGKKHFLVYLPGTQDWSPVSGANPLNLNSDLQAFAGSKSDSQTALQLALSRVGAKAGDDVMFVAHSQGGLVAANFAQHPSGFNVSSILSFAGPMVAVGALASTRVLAFEHTNDPIPYLAGKPNPNTSNWVTVQSTAKASGFAAHELTSYAPTAVLADKSTNPAIVAARTSLLSSLSASQVSVRLVRVRRKPN